MEAPADTQAPAATNAYKPPISLHGLICEEMQMNPPNFGNVATGDLERACYQFDVAQLEAILRRYIGTEDMYTQQYLYGVPDNIQLLEDMGKAVETPAAAPEVLEALRQKEPLFVRCLVVVFKAWHYKFTHAQALAAPAEAPAATDSEVSATSTE
jgi:hypothetical protein